MSKRIISLLILVLATFLLFKYSALSGFLPRSTLTEFYRQSERLNSLDAGKPTDVQCGQFDFFGYQSSFSEVVPVYLPNETDLRLIEPNLDALFVSLSDTRSQPEPVWVEGFAKFNTKLFRLCKS